jgi:hypothetical protein
VYSGIGKLEMSELVVVGCELESYENESDRDRDVVRRAWIDEDGSSARSTEWIRAGGFWCAL